MSAANTDTHEAKHQYHLVDPSPWPAFGAFAGLVLAGGAILYMHNESMFGIPGGVVLIVGGILTLATMFFWWRDVVREGEHQGHHTPIVQLGLRYGMALFIASEVMFFVAFFWAYFDAGLFADGGPLNSSTGGEQVREQYLRAQANGETWPPKGFTVFNPWGIPFLNTLILLTSGVTVTWAHHALREGNRKAFIQGMSLTILLGLCFTALQAYEYIVAPFSFGMLLDGDEKLTKGGIYSSTFFMATGFHGFHVIVGTIFLIVCLVRGMKGHFKPDHHFGLEAAAWYWHFVDVVWLFLFASIYWWGAGNAPLH